MFDLSKIKEARKAKGYKQEHLAHLTGIPQSTLSRIENGSKSPSLDEFSLLLEALGLSPQMLMKFDFYLGL
jgi:transcriptional regulator with XRE-family HTH domain